MAVAGCAWIGRMTRDHWGPSTILVVTILSLLAGYHVLLYDLALLAPPVAMLLAGSRRPLAVGALWLVLGACAGVEFLDGQSTRHLTTLVLVVMAAAAWRLAPAMAGGPMTRAVPTIGTGGDSPHP
jgi:hypothetical protein